MKSCQEEPAASRIPSLPRPLRVQPDCVLSVGSQRLPAAIAEERGGTLHVLVQGSPQFWVEDDGELATPDADLAVRVFNIVRVEADDDGSGRIPTFRIGLERLGEVERAVDFEAADLDEAEPEEADAGAKKKRCMHFRSILALVIAAVVLVGVSWRHQFWTIFPLQSSSNDKTNIAPPASEPPKVESTPDSATPGMPPETSDLWHLPGVLPFLQAEVAKKLDLTPNQADAIDRLDRVTQEASGDLEKYWGSRGRWELARKRSALMDEARQQALQLLTEPQRKLWDEMTR
jgi:hypothetical protein